MSEIRANTTEPGPFTPPWLADDPAAPAFRLRAGSVIEREMLEAELAGEYRAGRVWPYELAQVLADAFRAIGGEDASMLIDLVQRELAHTVGDGEPLGDTERATLDGARQVAVEHWPDYAALVGQMQRREALLPVLAFRRFCTGWDNLPVTFARGLGGMIADAALKGVKPLYIRAAGIAAYNLLYLDESAEKNSAPPSSSNDAPPISGSGGALAEAGTSTDGDGTKIPS